MIRPKESRVRMSQAMRESWARRRAAKAAAAEAPANGSLREAVAEVKRGPAPAAAPSNGQEITDLLDRIRLGFAAVLDLVEHRAEALQAAASVAIVSPASELAAGEVVVAGDPLALTIIREALCLARAGDNHDEWKRAYEALCCAAIEYGRQHPTNTKPVARSEKAKK